MISIRRFATVASLFTCLALGSSAVAFADANLNGAAAADAGARPHRHHGGRGDLLRASLHLESLSTAQSQQIEALVQGERAAHANIESARSELLKAIASRVAAGSVDDVALTPKVQAVEGAIQADEPGDRAALEALHGILTPAQRVELVTKLQSHGTGHGEHRDASAGSPRGEHGPGMLGRALNLTDAQKQQIEVNLRSIGPAPDKAVWREARESRSRMLEAFKGDRFVMKEVAPARDARVVEQGVERIVRVAKASAPVLTPEQRVVASTKLQEMAARGVGGPRK